MKIIQNNQSDNVVFVKAKALVNTYFIFRNNGEEVTITVNENHTIKSNHKLFGYEMDFLREEYPHFFQKTI